MKWEPRALATGLGFPEGPVYLGDGTVAFTEIRGQCVSIHDGDGYRVLARTGGGANGATLGADGALYIANNGGLSVGPGGYWFASDQIEGRIQRVTLDGACDDVVATLPGDAPHRPNDICFGPDGMLYFTDPRNWEHLSALKPGRLWRAHPTTGAAEVIAEIPNFCNGVAFGPDPSKLYVAQSMAMAILEFDWTPDGVGEPRTFCTLPRGFPDGFCFAADGTLIVCGSMGDVLQVFDATGALIQTIETGEGTEPTNCCLGVGELYVTMSGSGELVACDTELEALPLFPARASA